VLSSQDEERPSINPKTEPLPGFMASGVNAHSAQDGAAERIFMRRTGGHTQAGTPRHTSIPLFVRVRAPKE